jgi:glutathione synthase/RimK-type ligase-like ATP-grasp enzyme
MRRHLPDGDRKRVAFLTCSRLPDLAADDLLAQPALRAAGIDVEPAVWDSPVVRWERYDAVVVRSCWDYYLRPDEFRRLLSCLEALGVPLWNPPGLLRWNMDKSYLRDLAGRGLPVLPSVWIEQGAAPDLAGLLDARGWDEAVVKPTVSANGYATWRVSRTAAPGRQADFAELVGRGGAMVQRFAEEVRSQGEWSLLYFFNGSSGSLAGRFSHAVLKRPRPGDFRVQHDYGGTAEAAMPPTAVRRQAEQILDQVSGPWLYARVDGCVIGGHFHLMELEMLEPSLFFEHAPGAAGRFAAALGTLLRGAPAPALV